MKQFSRMAIYRDSFFGPNFSFHIYIADNADSNGNSVAGFEFYGEGDGFYSVPTAVTNQYTVLAILGDPGAVSRFGRNGGTKVFK